MVKIGLFPLNLVLFPEAVIPLHIFEERYKALINMSIDNNEPFGIILSNPKISKAGCTAKVTNILRRYSNGRLDILVRGIKRYNLNKFIDGEEIYFTGEIDYFDDSEKEFDPELLEICVKSFNEMISSVKELYIEKIDINNLNMDQPSFFIAQKSGLSLEGRQKLLETKSENKRLLIINHHLKRVMPLVQESEKKKKIIKNDGYFTTKFFDM